MLYRYLALKSVEQLQWLSDLLISGKVFFPRASRFNDPNEFRFQFRVPEDKTVIQRTWQQDHPNGTHEEFEAWFSSTSFKSWHIYLEPLFHRDLIYGHGLLCLSEKPDNPTMWGHYADNHRGICLGFDDLALDSFPGMQMCGKVQYQEALPIVRYFGEDSSQIIYNIFFTKCSDWKYEREFRLVADGDAKLTMNPSMIREIILGMRIEETVAKRVKEFVSARQTPIPVRKANLSYLTYEMELS